MNCGQNLINCCGHVQTHCCKSIWWIGQRSIPQWQKRNQIMANICISFLVGHYMDNGYDMTKFVAGPHFPVFTFPSPEARINYAFASFCLVWFDAKKNRVPNTRSWFTVCSCWPKMVSFDVIDAHRPITISEIRPNFACVRLTKWLRLPVWVHCINSSSIERDFYLVSCINWPISVSGSVGSFSCLHKLWILRVAIAECRNELICLRCVCTKNATPFHFIELSNACGYRVTSLSLCEVRNVVATFSRPQRNKIASNFNVELVQAHDAEDLVRWHFNACRVEEKQRKREGKSVCMCVRERAIDWDMVVHQF